MPRRCMNPPASRSRAPRAPSPRSSSRAPATRTMAVEIEPVTETPVQEANEPARKRPPVMVFVGLALLLVGAWWGFGKWNFARTHVSTDDAAVDGHIVPVLAKVGGYVQKVTVAENSRVKSDS